MTTPVDPRQADEFLRVLALAEIVANSSIDASRSEVEALTPKPITADAYYTLLGFAGVALRALATELGTDPSDVVARLRAAAIEDLL